MRRFTCDCGNILFFENTQCLQCGCEVGYSPAAGRMVVLAEDSALRRCANGVQYGVCNWLVTDAGNDLCRACRLNQVIPDMAAPGNLELWAKMEVAKRRVVGSLLGLGLALPSKQQDPVGGIGFEFLRSQPGAPVTTGHQNGVITVNIEEADDVARERNRRSLHEPSRTLLGHLRHETGHYVWDRWIGSLAPGNFRRLAFLELFGDESADYAAAMERYYREGPAEGWVDRFISGYATMHPWEDWAECWAHYLHILDAMETSESFGLDTKAGFMPVTRFPAEAGTLPAVLGVEATDPANQAFLAWLHQWARLSTVLNEISASLGQPAGLYPFVLSIPVARKMRFIHHLAHEAALRGTLEEGGSSNRGGG